MAATAPKGYVLMARIGDGDLAHLVRKGSEASLCGLPRAALEPGEAEHICAACTEWLPRRMAATGIYRTVNTD